jgi:TldD protein
MIVIRNGGLEVYGYGINEGLSIRTLVDGSMGFSTTDNLDPNNIMKVVESAVKLARMQGEGKIGLSDEKSYIVSYSIGQKSRFEDIPLEEKLEYLVDLDKKILSLANDVKIPSRTFIVNFTLSRKILATSEGTIIKSETPRIRIDAYIVLTYQDRSITRFVSIGGSVGWEAIKIWDPQEKFVNNITDLLKIIKEAKKVDEGKYDIILGPETSGLAAHESCGHPFELDRILGREGAQAGESFITVDMLGEEISCEEVTLIDDPTLPNSYGFYLYDDEGVKARTRLLIKEGRINEFLTNRETAYVLGTCSNASARSSAYNREPIVRMANTYFAPGTHSFDELIKDVKKGIYLKSFGEWNIDDRRYNMRFVGQEAYLIENGEIKHPLWNPIFEITIPEFYKSIDALDKNLEFEPATCGKSDPGQGVPVYTGGPNLRVRGVYVSSLV